MTPRHPEPVEGSMGHLQKGQIRTSRSKSPTNHHCVTLSGQGPVGVEGRQGDTKQFNVIARLDTPIEVDYYKNGGILQTVLRGMVG